tara:strand:- start:6180 stop:6605 length:426 start_codon:yes stop_codon:yes gene_type:complete
MIDYNNLLKKNTINVLKDILKHIENHGLTTNNQIFISFFTNYPSVRIPDWLKEKYPEEMTIVIQHEFYDLNVEENFFEITLSFSDIKTSIKIGYDSVISFADPSRNFGLKLINDNLDEEKKIDKIKNDKDNIINFANFKKN